MASLLIVDDDGDLAGALSDLLQGAGHFVRTAGTGEEGLRVLRAAQLPDCILLDIEMPVLTGPEMANRMLLHDAGEEFVPVVLVSGSPNLTAIAARIGTPYLIAKPVDGQTLLDLIDRAVHERIAPSFAGMKEEVALHAASRASATTHREVTDGSLREEREKTDAERRERRAAVEHEADEVVKLARGRADAVLRAARAAEEVHTRRHNPGTREVQAESRREERAADVATKSERASADHALQVERSQNQRILEDFLEAERTLTDVSLEDERLHSDVTITSRDEFLGMVSHDLRSLLNGVSLNVSLITRSAAPGASGTTTRKWTANIQRVIGRMNRLIGDLLDIASIEAGKMRIVPEPVDAHRLVVETMEAFAEIAKSKDIVTDFAESTVAEEPIYARLDHGRVVQVLANLISNAMKFTQPGGNITVRVIRVEDKVQFSVADNGPGIPAELLTAVFERYRQIHADRRGLGLGLYISKAIVEAHGGTIWAESQMGKGTTIYFEIPRDGVASRVGVGESPPAHA